MVVALNNDIDVTGVNWWCMRWGVWLRSGEYTAGPGAGFNYEPSDASDAMGFNNGIDDPDCEVLDMIIAREPDAFRRVLIARYYWDFSDRQAALALKMNKTRFRMVAGYALQWLDGHLVALTGRPVSDKTVIRSHRCRYIEVASVR